jgi:hypothetical protein
MPKYKVPNFGPGGRPETFNTASVVSSGTAPINGGPNGSGGLQHEGDLGVVYEEGTKRWQVVELVDTNAIVGDVLYWKSYTARTVTPTIGNSSQNEVAGICEVVSLTPVASTTRVFIAVRQGGVMPVKSADATINARGLRVISDTGSNRLILMAVDTNAAQTKIVEVGIAQAAQAAGFVSTYLKIPSI